MSETTTSRARSVAVVATSALLGGALGIGGASFALWEDAVSFDGEISSGYEYFAAGRGEANATTVADSAMTAASDPVAPPTGDSVSVTVGAADAQVLVDDQELAIPLRTDSLSQGNKGLHYTLTEPDWGEGIFGAADVHLFPVPTAADCTLDNAPDNPAALISTPVSADYSDTTTPTTEYWCLVTTLNTLHDQGSYTNEVTATGTDPSGTEVSETDSWSAEVISAMDPADEPDHEIALSYTTFRPGEEPQP
ncbi:MAG TPA: hypothetical protein H9815_12235 [Candidatus Ruania gallistercoris]|uniref:SipW-cognate class signal peptide n=1 Tax=Candidatus Ruania gallistercoris TaxID=2838746 RepID=A0A9D2EF77_9MICO|nr:hypothetical protein [Candidatus Ruania gallistercoris]